MINLVCSFFWVFGLVEWGDGDGDGKGMRLGQGFGDCANGVQSGKQPR